MTNYLLIDAHNLFHRCKHTTTGDPAVKAGMALHITLNAIKNAWRKFHADHVVFCLEGKSWRRAVYPDYKAHRRVATQLASPKEREEDALYFGAMDTFIEFLRKRTNVTVLQSVGVEADDFIARWTQVHPDDNHVIVSSDSDFYQLLSDRVRIYDGVKGWTISHTEVLDEKDNPAIVSKNVKIKDPKSGKMITKATKQAVEPPDPEYELFFKIIRGDSSDNVLSAYPGVRENGSSKKPGIKEAYEDRHNRGFEWNNFMLQEWKKPVGREGDEFIYETVRVTDQYRINQQLIDLTQQPEEIKDLMDITIAEAVSQPPKPQVGIWLLRFTEEMGLFNIGKSPTEFATVLAAPYVPFA
jgi:5'-3' exonuclease